MNNKIVNINLEDYLGRDEIKDIVIDVLRHHVKLYFEKEEQRDRILSNISYKIVFDMVDKHFDLNLSEILKEKVIKIINKLSEYSVFRTKSSYENKNSIAQNILEDAVKKNENLIHLKIKEIIEKVDYEKTLPDIGEILAYEFFELIKKGNNK